jgi:anti-sigma-K factor RskA
MNKNHHISNQAELEQLINRYFDGETSVQEEQMLRETLADCPWSSEAIDEARFTMGYFVAHRKAGQQTSMKSYRRQVIGIAASIAIILAIGIPAMYHSWFAPQPQCIAYVNGKVIDNDDAVMALIASDLNKMEDASNSMAAQLQSLGEALELDNN